MYKILISVSPAGIGQLDLDTSRESYQEAQEFFDFLKPHLQTIHWLAAEFKANKCGVKIDRFGRDHE